MGVRAGGDMLPARFATEPMTATTSPTAPWLVNPLLRVHRHARAQDGAVLELDDAQGRALRLRTSHGVADLLMQLRADPIAVAHWTSATLPAEDAPVQRFLMEDCVDHRILVRAGDDTCAKPQEPRPSYLSAMWPLLPPHVVNPLASRLQGLFGPRAIAIVCIMVAGAFWSLFSTLQALLFQPVLGADEVLAVGAASAFGILLHELGHAAAAYRFGARRVGIGVGLYLVIPVAYSDLSEVWRCSRPQRIIVNLAGVAMQGLWLAALMLAYQVLGNDGWLVAASATAVSMLWNLNPFLRMDGYWILADAFGVHDLRSRARSELQRLCLKLRSRDSSISLRPGILVYALLSALFLGWLLVRALQFLGGVLLNTLPQLHARLAQGSVAELGGAEWVLAAISIAWQVLMVVVATRFLLGTPKRLAAFFRRTR